LGMAAEENPIPGRCRPQDFLRLLASAGWALVARTGIEPVFRFRKAKTAK